MARSFNGSTDRVDYSNAYDIGAQAQSASCWVNYTPGAANQVLLEVYEATDTDRVLQWHIRQEITGDDSLQVFFGGTGNVVVRSTDRINSTGWQHVGYTYDGGALASGITLYINGAAVSGYDIQVDGTEPMSSATGSWSIGGRIYADTLNLNGQLANYGWWNRQLSSAEWAILGAGYSPLFIRNGLQWAPDLVRSQRDRITGFTGTLDGTSVAAQPRTIWQSASIYRFAGAALQIPPLAMHHYRMRRAV